MSINRIETTKALFNSAHYASLDSKGDESSLGHPAGYSAVGAAAEYRVIAKLLELGHKVAKPVVDDDGVDLVVNYWMRVQVKATRNRSNREGYLNVPIRVESSGRLYDVEALVVLDRDADVFYVLPRGVIGTGKRMALSPKYDVWREAWHVFGDEFWLGER